jgi:hypothetical protein
MGDKVAQRVTLLLGSRQLVECMAHNVVFLEPDKARISVTNLFLDLGKSFRDSDSNQILEFWLRIFSTRTSLRGSGKEITNIPQFDLL